MRNDIATDSKANRLGSLWMVGSMAAFAIEDAFVKAISQTLPVGQILILFGLGGSLIFACLAVLTGTRLWTPDILSKPMCIRVIFEIVGRLFYVLAISLSALSAATVILQATPLIVVAGAALIFGERVGWRRWAAILMGLAGVIVIVQPGGESFSVLSILAVMGMIGFAGRDLASRAAPKSLGALVLGFYGFLSVVIAGLLIAIWQATPFVVPASRTSALMVAAILAGVVAYGCLMKAMRTGEVSAVTPFRYTRLVFGVAIGVVIFREQLDLPMAVGCAMIVLSGLFIVGRTKAVAQKP